MARDAAALGGEGRRPLTTYTHISYGAPAAPLSLAGLPLAVYLPVIYADSDGFGLGLTAVGAILMLTRVFDAVTDPLIGRYSDKWRTRWGRRKPWVLLGTPIFGLGMWYLFHPPFEFSDVSFLGATFSNGYLWLFATLVVFFVGATIKDVPYSAWGAELSSNYNERTLIMSWKEFFSVGGSMLAAFTPSIILFFGYDKPTEAVLALVLMMCITMPLINLNCLVGVPEWPVVEQDKKPIRIMDGLKVAMGNKPFMMLVVVFAVGSIGSAMTNSLSFFFVKHVLMAGELYGLYLAPYFVCQAAAIPLWFKLSRRIGKHKATMWAVGWYALWSSFIPLIAVTPAAWYAAFEITNFTAILPASTHAAAVEYFAGMETGKFLFFIVIMCLKGSAIGALSALPFAMFADVVDVDTAQTGKRRAGEYMAIWSMTKKGAYALGIFIGLALVEFWGFDALADPRNTTNTAFALLMLACTYSVIPALFKFIGMPLLWKYPLTEDKLREVQKEADAKHGIGGDARAAPSAA